MHGFVDPTGNVLRFLSETDLNAISTAGSYVGREFSCFIAQNHGAPKLLGSGTLVQVGNRVFVATAKHLFKDLGPHEVIGIYWGEEDNRCGLLRSEVIEAGGDMDVAALPLNVANNYGIEIERVDIGFVSKGGNLFVVSGVPGESFNCDEGCKTVTAGHWSLGLVDIAPSSWPTLEPAVVPNSHLIFNYSNKLALDSNGEPMKRVSPFGLSGGGVWHIPERESEKSSPQQVRLVGVQSSVEEGNWNFLVASHVKEWIRLLPT